MPKRKILVPTDFSPETALALDMAIDISHLDPADIYLFYVYEGSTKNYRELDKINTDTMDKMKIQVLEALQRAQQRRGDGPTVSQVFQRMANGKAFEEIIMMSTNINADYIVMGLRSHGKTAERVVKGAPCSVFLLRPKEAEMK